MFNLPPGKPDELRLKTPEAVWRAMPGAVSGSAGRDPARCGLRECYRRMDKSRYALFASGGVFTAQDAYAKIRMGASLVGLLTALVYEGPGVVRRITQELAQLLQRDGIKNVREAVGVDAR